MPEQKLNLLQLAAGFVAGVFTPVLGKHENQRVDRTPNESGPYFRMGGSGMRTSFSPNGKRNQRHAHKMRSRL
jgi:hypothetical protein